MFHEYIHFYPMSIGTKQHTASLSPSLSSISINAFFADVARCSMALQRSALLTRIKTDSIFLIIMDTEPYTYHVGVD